MKLKVLLRLVLSISAFLVIWGCVKVDDVIFDDWKPEVALPLVHTSVTLLDFLESAEEFSTVEVDDSNFVMLTYQSEIFSQRAEEELVVPDLNITLADTSFTVPTSNFPFNFRLDRIILKESVLRYRFASNELEPLTITLHIPNLLKDGKAFEQTFALSPIGGSNQLEGQVDIDGYLINFVDEFELRYIATNAQGERKILDNSLISLQNLTYTYIEGNLGELTFNLPLDSIVVDLFEQSIAGNFSLRDPKVNLIFENTIGVPVRAISRTMFAHTQKYGIMQVISPLDQGYDFAFPTLNEVGQTATSTLELNTGNSNISDLISALPYRLDYQFEVTGFPEGTEDLTGFMLDTSTFKVFVDVELPLWGRADGLTYETTTELEPEDLEQADSALIRIVTNNGFPVDASIQLFFEDAQGNVLETLVEDVKQIADAATVDADGNVIAPAQSVAEIGIDKSKIDVLSQATQMRLYTVLSTSEEGQKDVRFYADYELETKVGIKAIFDPIDE